MSNSISENKLPVTVSLISWNIGQPSLHQRAGRRTGHTALPHTTARRGPGDTERCVQWAWGQACVTGKHHHEYESLEEFVVQSIVS